MKQKNLILIGAVAILAIVAIALIANTSTNERKSDELICATAAHDGEPEFGFDPMLGWGAYHEPLIHSTLFKIKNDTSIENDLATSYQTSDSKVWIVNIRDDVKFHDGTPLTAEDVSFSFNTAKNSEGYLDFTSLKEATALNKTSIRFDLNHPDSTFIFKLARLGIVPKNSYKEGEYGQNPIGSGPYKFVQWDKSQQTIFERNDDYYGKKPYIKRLTILYMENDAALAAAKRGDVDVAEISLAHANDKVEGMKLVPMKSYDSRYVSLPNTPNNGKKTKDDVPIGNNVTSDISIRKALYYGMNREELINHSMNGYGDVDYTGVDKLPWCNNETKIKDNDITKAKEILREGGWKDTDGDGIVEKDGKKATINLYYNTAWHKDEFQAAAETFSQQAKKIGIEVKFEGKSRSDIQRLKFSDATLNTYGTNDLDPVYSAYISKDAGTDYNNRQFYNNSKVDNYLEQSKKASTLEEVYQYVRLAAWDGTTGYSIIGDASLLYYADADYLYLVSDSLDIGEGNIVGHGGDPYANIYDWKRI